MNIKAEWGKWAPLWNWRREVKDGCWVVSTLVCARHRGLCALMHIHQTWTENFSFPVNGGLFISLQCTNWALFSPFSHPLALLFNVKIWEAHGRAQKACWGCPLSMWAISVACVSHDATPPLLDYTNAHWGWNSSCGSVNTDGCFFHS